MIKRSIRILSLCLFIVLLSASFAGCDKTAGIAPAENTYAPHYGQAVLEQSPNITIDGVLDDAVWQGKSWWCNTYANNQGAFPYFKFTAFPTEYGIYAAFVTDDHNLCADGQRNPQTNSNFEMYFAAWNADESFQGMTKYGELKGHKIHVDMRGELAGLYNNIERAIKVEGELNSGNTEGATLEMMASWSTLGVDVSKGVPDTVAVLPCYRAVLAQGGATTFTAAPGGNIYNAATYYLFNQNGYNNADKEGAMLGDGANGISKSAGWDMSQISEGVVRSTQPSQCFIFFKDMQAENFVVETTMIPVQAISDSWPKAGICFQQADGLYFAAMLDPGGKNGTVDSINGTKNFPNYQLVTLDQHDGNWNQYSLGGYEKANPNATKQEGVKFTVVKYGNSLWYFADGKYLTSQSVDWISGECLPGLFTLGYEVLYKDYSCKAITVDELQEYLNAVELYTVEVELPDVGGDAFASTLTVEKGDSYEVTLMTKPGYRVSSVTVNGTEMLDKLRSTAKDGTFKIENVNENQKVVVSYEKLESFVTYSGTITDGAEGIRADMILINKQDGTIRYEDTATSKGFSLEIPAGTYEVRVSYQDGAWQSKTVTITEDMEDTIVYEAVPENTEG